MKQTKPTTADEQIKNTITDIEEWVKKFSFLYVRYKSWSISIVADWKTNDRLDYPMSYNAGSNENAKAVLEHFKKKGIKEEISPATGQYIYIYKSYSI